MDSTTRRETAMDRYGFLHSILRDRNTPTMSNQEDSPFLENLCPSCLEFPGPVAQLEKNCKLTGLQLQRTGPSVAVGAQDFLKELQLPGLCHL
jgi:hypothetical protein